MGLEFKYFYNNGAHYILTTFYIMRILGLPFGVLGLSSVQRQSFGCANIYSRLALIQMSLITAIGWLSSYDMCASYVYYESCQHVFMT